MNYTEQAKEVLKIAKAAAKELKHPYIGTEHLLVGLKKVYTGVAGQVLAMNGVSEENILKIMNELVSPGEEALSVRIRKSVRDWSIFWRRRKQRQRLFGQRKQGQSICCWHC